MRNLALFILALILLSGCKVTEQKARGYYLDNKDKLAKLCVDCFPPQIKYIPGEVQLLKADTVYEKGRVDTVEADCPDGTKVKKDCPPCNPIIINKEFIKVDTVRDDNHPMIYYWKSEYQKEVEKNLKLSVKLESTESISSSRFWWNVALGGMIFLRVAWWLFSLYKGKGIV